jgi:tRNA pseudouridine13 synthase
MKNVGVAGLKDKYAVTRQWISVPQHSEQALETLDTLGGVRIMEMSRHHNKLGVGHLIANRFEITVRCPANDWQTRATAKLSYLKKYGLPNYFGPQRFGHFNSNVIDAMRLLRGEKVPGGRSLHTLFLNSLQSHLFNWMLKLRIESGLYQRVLNGDWAKSMTLAVCSLLETRLRKTSGLLGWRLVPPCPCMDGRLGTVEEMPESWNWRL